MDGHEISTKIKELLIAEGRKHKRYREVVQSCILHSCESWSWNTEVVDTLHCWESRNSDLMSSRRWAQTGLSLVWFRANQIRKARQRLAEGGGENIAYLVLQRIWNYFQKTFDKKRNNMTDKMMRNILTHANPEWREQRSICARILDPKNQDRMKRRRAGVVHTIWDNLMMKWSGSQRWWDVSNDWKSFVQTAEDWCRRTLERDEDIKKKGFSLIGGEKRFQNKAEEERKKNKIKEREKQRIWDPAWGNQMRIQILGDSNQIVNWMNVGIPTPYFPHVSSCTVRILYTSLVHLHRP